MFYKTKKFMLIILLSIIIPHNFIYAGKLEFNINGNVYTLDDSKITFSISNRIIPIQNKCMFAFTLCEYFDMRTKNEIKSYQVQDLLHTQEMLDILDLNHQANDFISISTRSAINAVTQIQNSIQCYNDAIHKYSQASSKCDKLIHTTTDKKSLDLLDLFKNYFMAKSQYYNLCIQRCEILLEAYTSRH